MGTRSFSRNAISSSIWTKWKDVWRRFSGQGAYPHELAAILLIPLRRIVLSPEKLIPHLHLVRTSRILEVGPGPGFFSVDVAQAVPQGRLELVDIQREMLQKARRRLQRAGVPNVGYTQATAAKLPFQSRTFDIAFLVAVLGEVPDPKACMNSIADVLRPDGLLVVAELPGDPDALAEEQLRDLTQGTGLEFVESLRVSRSVITSFRRRAKDPDMRAA
jgi:ubiquinone/menaquinone biosynthesis C-methylase UbiE